MPNIALEKMNEYFQQGNIFYNQGNLKNALASYQEALAINPNAPEVLANLAAVLQKLGKSEEAQKVLFHCLKIKPHYADALNTLGNTYKSADNKIAAAKAYFEACSAEPTHLHAWLNLGQVLHQMKDYEGSIAAYNTVLAISPNHIKALGEMTSMLHLLCRWKTLPVIEEQLRKAIRNGQCTEPFVAALYTPELELENAIRYSAKLYPYSATYNPAALLPVSRRPKGKLRIGYLSSDFYRHATAHLMSELFENHDRKRFEIYAYSYGIDDASAARERIMNGVDQFRDIREVTDQEACNLIHSDGIDILVDLKGYTLDHRQSLMALRPAPIQMHYLGYPGTTGAPFMDYFIADAITAPPGTDALFTEKLIRLPHSYQINDRKRSLPSQALARAAYGLPEKGFVFCAFNQSFKFTPDIFAVWMRLLLAIKGSVLWLYETHPEASANLRQEAQKYGIDPARLIIAALILPEEHLARAQHADLFLDTYPCNAHTTASDMLWCGVPVVTMAGDKFISRVAASLLHAVGLPELVTKDLQAYEALALSLAGDTIKLMELRKYLKEGRMQFPLFDSKATTRALEAAYAHAAKLHPAGRAPHAFSVTDNLNII